MQTPARIALIYAAVALVWILFSDQALRFAAGEDDSFVTTWQSIKGLLFVAVTAFTLYGVLRYYFHHMEQQRIEKHRVFENTVDAAGHILNNFLNDMIYFRMVAEDTPFIDQSVLEEYDRVIEETTDKLRDLAAMEDVSVASIRLWIQQGSEGAYCVLDEDEGKALPMEDRH